MDTTPTFPTDITPELSLFDRFATHVTRLTSKSWFFVGCLLSIVIWAPSYFLIKNLDTWQLIINTGTTIITYLLVSLLQNTQTRDTKALHTKLNAIADGLADLSEAIQQSLPEGAVAVDLQRDIEELRAAVGVEHRESS